MTQANNRHGTDWTKAPGDGDRGTGPGTESNRARAARGGFAFTMPSEPGQSVIARLDTTGDEPVGSVSRDGGQTWEDAPRWPAGATTAHTATGGPIALGVADGSGTRPLPATLAGAGAVGCAGAEGAVMAAIDDAPIRRFTVEHGAAEVQRDPGARVLWPAVEVEEPVGAFLLSLSGAGRTVVHVEHGGALLRVVVERVPEEGGVVLPGVREVVMANEPKETDAPSPR